MQPYHNAARNNYSVNRIDSVKPRGTRLIILINYADITY